MDPEEQQPIRLATLDRVSSYSAVSTWWNAVTECYSNAKNSENRTLAGSVVLVERLATPALRGLSRVPEYCPEGIVETVDGVAVSQLDVAESLVARSSETVSNSTSYVLSTKDAAVARGTEMCSLSTSYVLSTKDAVVSRGTDMYTGSTAYAVSAQERATSIVTEGTNYVSSTRDYASSSLQGGRQALEETVTPYTSRVTEWRNALRQRFVFGAKKQAVPEKDQEEKKRTPFDRVASVFPSIVRFDGDRVMVPIRSCFEGFQSRRDFARQMFQQAQETGERQVRATRDFIQPAVAHPAETVTSLKETSLSYATRALTSQRNLLETIRESVISLEKNRGTNSESHLLRQLDYVPSFVFTWTAKTIDFSDGVLAWTHNYVAPQQEVPEQEQVQPEPAVVAPVGEE